MDNWYFFALLALLFMGVQRFLYKVSAERGCNTAWTTFSFMGTVSVLSSTLFLASGDTLINLSYLVFISLLNSASFAVATMTHIESLKHVPASVAYPLIRLNTVIVILFSIIFFKEHLSLYQIAGILTALGVMIILAREFEGGKASSGNMKRGLLFVTISAIFGAVASISSKFAALHTQMLAFMALSYISSTLFSFGLRKKMDRGETAGSQKEALIIGLLMGLFNFIGYYAFLKALKSGPLSIVASIMGMQFVIAIALSALIYKEKLTLSRILGISLTLVSMVLLRL